MAKNIPPPLLLQWQKQWMEAAGLVEQLLVLLLWLRVKTCAGNHTYKANPITIKAVFLSPICLRPVMLHYVPVLQMLHVVVVVLIENTKLSLLLLCLGSQLFGQH